MKKCPFCGYSNYDNARACRKCDNSFLGDLGSVYSGRPLWLGPRRAKMIRSHALSLFVIGLFMKVYWGGYGPWPVLQFPTPVVTFRTFAEPVLLCGGALLYIFGWIAVFI
jgi:hypothetical protein